MNNFWQTPGTILEVLRDDGLAQFLHVDQSTQFLAEVAFLNHWNASLDDAPNQEGLAENYAYRDDTGVVYEIIFQPPDAEPDEAEHILMIYTPHSAHPERHGLRIIHNDFLVYERTPDQDERTEWQINGMANDPNITDAEGNVLFIGDPTNI